MGGWYHSQGIGVSQFEATGRLRCRSSSLADEYKIQLLLAAPLGTSLQRVAHACARLGGACISADYRLTSTIEPGNSRSITALGGRLQVAVRLASKVDSTLL